MNEKNKQLVENPTSNNALVSLHSFEAETRLACVPEHKLKSIIGYRTESYHPIDENYKLIVSPNDEYIAEQCGKAIYLIRRNTLNVFQVIPLEGIKTSFVFTPDSKDVIVGDSIGKISIWEIETGVCQNVIETKRKSIKNIYISHDGKTLCLDDSDAIELYKINTGECVRAFDFRVELLGFGPDDRSLVGMNANSIEVIDIHDGKTLRTYAFSYIAEAALSPGRNQILVVDAVGKKTSLDLKTGQSRDIQIISRFSNVVQWPLIHRGGPYSSAVKGMKVILNCGILKPIIKLIFPENGKTFKLARMKKCFMRKKQNKGKFSFWNIQNGEPII